MCIIQYVQCIYYQLMIIVFRSSSLPQACWAWGIVNLVIGFVILFHSPRISGKTTYRGKGYRRRGKVREKNWKKVGGGVYWVLERLIVAAELKSPLNGKLSMIIQRCLLFTGVGYSQKKTPCYWWCNKMSEKTVPMFEEIVKHLHIILQAHFFLKKNIAFRSLKWTKWKIP